MKYKIISEYPLWLAAVAFFVAFVYAFLFYRDDKVFKEMPFKRTVMMAAFRFVTILIICLLLLSILFQSFINRVEKPILIFAQDNTESLLLSNNSNDDSLKNYKENVKILLEELSNEYEIHKYTFGQEVKNGLNLTFDEKLTDFSPLFSKIENNYFNQNVGALLIASDGIYNKGLSPIYKSKNINIPIYTIGLGDTTTYKDAFFSNVRYNEIAFLGNKFPIEMTIAAKKLKGKTTKLQIIHNGKIISSQLINIKSDDYVNKISVNLPADLAGIQKYKLNIVSINGELTVLNNTKQVVIEVIDNKQKILVLGNAPHPDLGTIKKALSSNLNYEIKVSTIEQFKHAYEEYNLIILHQLPSNNNTASNVINSVVKEKIPVLFILGQQSSFNRFNALRTGIYVNNRRRIFEESQAKINNSFQLFEISEDSKLFFETAPPLVTPFGEIQQKNNADIVFYQTIRGVETTKILVVVNNAGSIFQAKSAVIAGEGIWRWRIDDYKKNSSHQIFDAWLNKLIQFLAIKESKERFRLQYQRIYNENNPVIIDAQVYNESYEMVNDDEVFIDIYNSDDKKYSYRFTKSMQAYFLNLGTLPSGDYRFEAYVNQKEMIKNGSFTVNEIKTEAENLIANHQLLNQLSQQNNGKLFFRNNFDELKDDIVKNQKIKSVIKSEKSLIGAIQLKWLFFAILLLLSVEWFFRKFWGSY